MKKICSLLALLLLCHCVSAQQVEVFTPNNSPNIQIDRYKKKTDQPIPFDRSFTLQYPLDNEEIFQVHVYKAYMVAGVKDIYSRSDREPYIKSWSVEKNSLLMNMKGIPPNTLIDIAVLRKLNDQELDTLMGYNESLYTISQKNDPIIDAGIGVFYRKFIKKLSPSYGGEPLFEKMTYADYKKLFNDSLKKHLDIIKKWNFTDTVPLIKPEDISYFALKLRANKINEDDLLPLSQVVQGSFASALFSGSADITNLGSRFPDANDYKKRLARLQFAKQAIEKVLVLFDKFQMLDPDSAIKAFRNTVGQWHSKLKNNCNLLETNLKAITKTTKDNPTLTVEEWLITGNEFNDLEKLSKFVVMPDVGIATLALNGHKGWKLYPRPFVGINIYFRPVDKSLPEADFPKFNLMRVMSLQLGLTYGDIGKKEFSNLFNDFSLMVGPSFRFNRWFRLGAGTVLTTQTDANPIITDTHTHFGGYFAFSFDLDIFSNAGSVKSRIFK